MKLLDAPAVLHDDVLAICCDAKCIPQDAAYLPDAITGIIMTPARLYLLLQRSLWQHGSKAHLEHTLIASDHALSLGFSCYSRRSWRRELL